MDGLSFERWRRVAERHNPRLLMLSRADVTRGEDAALDEANFPDRLAIGPFTLALQYRFEPGHEDDGVTAIVPLHL